MFSKLTHRILSALLAGEHSLGHREMASVVDKPTTAANRASKNDESGQGLVEMAITLPIFLLALWGLVSGSWLLFQQQSVNNASRAAAREAAVLYPLFQNGTANTCATTYGEPTAVQASPAVPVETAAAQASTIVSVNTSILCAASAGATTMTSSAAQNGTATVTVTANPSLATPATVTVTVSYVVHPLAPLWPSSSMTLTSTSTENVQ